MTKLEKISEMLREYENGCEVSEKDLIEGIKFVVEDDEDFYDREAASIETPAGLLKAGTFPYASGPTAFISLVPKGSESEIMLVFAETHRKEILCEGESEEDLFVFTYSDPNFGSECTSKEVVKRSEVVNALGIPAPISELYVQNIMKRFCTKK